MAYPHNHIDKKGRIVECYHETKNMLCTYQFWLSMTLTFPIEHFIWEKLWPFTVLTHLLGL